MGRENARWGSVRIRGELAKLGISVSATKIRTLLRGNGLGLAPRRNGPRHVFLETCDFDAAWASVPRPGIVVTEREIQNDPVLEPLLEEWRSGNDSTHRRFMQHVLDWTEDEDEPN